MIARALPALRLVDGRTTPGRVRRGGPTERPVAVSVVVSTRGHDRYLEATVRAVEAQVGVAAELIVVDNASPDGTEALMERLLASASIPVTYVHLDADRGPAGGRNVGIEQARGDIVAFTDSDCVPDPGWLLAACNAFAPGVGIVQGRTTRVPHPAPPFFSHFIETLRDDASFSTSNVVYRRAALGSHRFDPSCRYWEDTDLGWRVRADGWGSVFADDAVVRHQVIPQTPTRWLLWTTHYANWPAKAAAYPGFRRALFLGLWVRPLHLLLQVALVGLVAARRRPVAVLLAVPYAVASARSRRYAGRAPLAKAAAHLVRDLVGTVTLVVASIRHRSVVL